MKFLAPLTLFALSLSASSVQTANAQKPAAVAPNAPIVAELFTSQGCSSCPAAESLFSKLADREDILTLEWHVDYWDDLVHGGSRWKDPYSKRAFTKRQRAYNRALRGKNAIYTPQAVINGHFEGVGSRADAVDDMLNNAPAHSVALQISDGKIRVGPGTGPAEIIFLRLLKQHETDVTGGENKGRKLSGRNIVLETSIVGKLSAKAGEFTLPTIGKGESCAVIVQNRKGDLGAIKGAAKC
jgi:hypothetical protein